MTQLDWIQVLTRIHSGVNSIGNWKDRELSTIGEMAN